MDNVLNCDSYDKNLLRREIFKLRDRKKQRTADSNSVLPEQEAATLIIQCDTEFI
jgi:hypothetical protein